MTKDEALRMAIEHIEHNGATTERKMVLHACKEALEQPLTDCELDAKRYQHLRNTTSIMMFELPTWVTSHKLDMRVDKMIMEKQND